MSKEAMAAERFASVVFEAWEVVNQCEDRAEPPGMATRVKPLRATLQHFADLGTIPKVYSADSPQPVFLRPQEGDVCVLAFPGLISANDMDRMAANWKEQIPGVKMIIAESCSGVQSFRPAKGGDDVHS